MQARQRPTLDGERQDQPTQQIAEVIGDDAEQQADLVGPEAVTRKAGPMGGSFALLDPLLRGPALVVEADNSAVGPGQGGREQEPVASVGTVDVPRPEFRTKAVAVLIEDEERMVTDRLEVPIVG